MYANHKILNLHKSWIPILILTCVGVLKPAGDSQTTGEIAVASDRRKLFPMDPKAYVLGKFDPDTTEDFTCLPTDLTRGRTGYLRKETVAALQRLVVAAQEDGIEIWVVSATRNWWQQRRIWESKFTGGRQSGGQNLAVSYPDTLERCLAILQYSSAPGISRHHWGTDVDLNSTRLSYWYTEEGIRVLEWMQTNAKQFGFLMAYPEGRDSGYTYEPWHWSHAPISRPILRHYYRELIKSEDLEGFIAAEFVRQLPWLEEYVYGVNVDLR